MHPDVYSELKILYRARALCLGEKAELYFAKNKVWMTMECVGEYMLLGCRHSFKKCPFSKGNIRPGELLR